MSGYVVAAGAWVTFAGLVGYLAIRRFLEDRSARRRAERAQARARQKRWEQQMDYQRVKSGFDATLAEIQGLPECQPHG